MRNYYETRGSQTSDDDRLTAAVTYIAEGDPRKAIGVFQQRLAVNPGPISQLHVAMLADELNDTALRDRALKAQGQII
jgi:hypothetical protein